MTKKKRKPAQFMWNAKFQDEVKPLSRKDQAVIHKMLARQLPREDGQASPEERIVPAERSDAVNHPSHYQGKVEVIEYIEDKNFCYHLGNAVKYISRAGKKDPSKTIEDLEKASWYLNRKIQLLKGNTAKPNDTSIKR